MNLIKIIQKNKSMQMWQGKEKQHLKEKKEKKKEKTRPRDYHTTHKQEWNWYAGISFKESMDELYVG